MTLTLFQVGGWILSVGGLGLCVGLWWSVHVERILTRRIYRQKKQQIQLLAEISRLTDEVKAVRRSGNEPPLVHPEPAGAPAAGPGRHEAPREGNEGV